MSDITCAVSERVEWHENVWPFFPGPAYSRRAGVAWLVAGTLKSGTKVCDTLK